MRLWSKKSRRKSELTTLRGCNQESFYCALEECTETLERTSSSNNTRHECQKVQCECIPGRMLCGESGSVGE